MRWMFLLLFVAGCASVNSSDIRPRLCGSTPVQLKEMESFGFTPPAGKAVVVRLFTTWCPYCKEDLAEIGKHFKSGAWNEQNVHVLLMTYRNRRETRESFDKFMRQTFPKFGIPLTAAQVVFVNRGFKELSASKASNGKPLFPEWQGVPYGLVFGKDGRLAYRGHFNESPASRTAHYTLISDIARETCEAG